MRTAIALLGAVFALGVTAGGAQATAYDAAAGFSATSNPNGAWTYGYEDSLRGTFHPYPDMAPVSGFPNRGDYGVPGFSTYSMPADFHNVTGGTVTLAAGPAAFHPGDADGSIGARVASVPEPGTIALIVVAVLGLAAARARKARQWR